MYVKTINEETGSTQYKEGKIGYVQSTNKKFNVK